jgi:hypothetical protein
MADLSLGPLRIANPDDASSPDTALEPRIFTRSTQSVSPISPTNGEVDYLSRPRAPDTDPVSPMDNVHTHTAQAAVRVATRSPVSRDNYLARQSQRNSMAYTYQDQQQEQFPQYPTMMPQNLHDPRSNASRPVSTFYTQPTPQPQPQPSAHIGHRETSQGLPECLSEAHREVEMLCWPGKPASRPPTRHMWRGITDRGHITMVPCPAGVPRREYPAEQRALRRRTILDYYRAR